MNRCDCSRHLYEDGLEGGGLGGQHSDEGADGGVPQDHGPPMCSRLGEREILSIKVFRIKMTNISALKWQEEGRKITLMEHWFTQED